MGAPHATPPTAPTWQALAWPLLLVPLLAAAQGPEPGGPMGQLKLPSFNVVGSVDIDQIAKLRQTFEPKDTPLEPDAVQTH